MMTIKEKLLEGKVVNAHTSADLSRHAAPKSKQFTATRLPGGYKALIELQTKAGLVELEIDAPTALAIASVFSDGSPDEGTDKGATKMAGRNRCKSCNKPGHNSRTCPLGKAKHDHEST